MKLEIKSKTVTLTLTRKQFAALEAALDSIAEGTSAGAYMDVVRLYDSMCRVKARLFK